MISVCTKCGDTVLSAVEDECRSCGGAMRDSAARPAQNENAAGDAFGSDALPPNVALAVKQLYETIQALEARIEELGARCNAATREVGRCAKALDESKPFGGYLAISPPPGWEDEFRAFLDEHKKDDS